MLTFVSLFLGLIAGVHPVELWVADGVTCVEILLDGEVVGTLTAEPWVLPCDFGDLSPHELVAVGYDAQGEKVARVRQGINLPRPLAEAALVFEDGVDGRGALVRVAWESLYDQQPSAIAASFDGEPIPVSDLGWAALPYHDPRQLHFVRFEIDFPSGLVSVAEAVFGGLHQDQVQAQLTAAPLEATGRRRVPRADDLEGWLAHGDETLRVAAVEKGIAEVVIVADRAAAPGLADLSRTLRRPVTALTRQVRVEGARISTTPAPFAALDEHHRLRLLAPFPRRSERDDYALQLFPQSLDYFPIQSRLLWEQLALAAPPAAEVQRLAEAVAVAGLSAAAKNHRRGVVLILGEDQQADAGSLEPKAVRRYLGRLGVPLFVWTVAGSDAETAWGPARSISSGSRLVRAIETLSRALERQRVVWVEGNYLPHEIELTALASGVALAGRAP